MEPHEIEDVNARRSYISGYPLRKVPPYLVQDEMISGSVLPRTSWWYVGHGGPAPLTKIHNHAQPYDSLLQNRSYVKGGCTKSTSALPSVPMLLILFWVIDLAANILLGLDSQTGNGWQE
ncbi:uncharacterized protein LY89DRAFT_678503 [Mollisia scopiformis]|uniref:Uncharacterized protein n=1 Tax=Mollisia scopiformis TaxID=149040 RepID=A0A132B3M5_MOLSC|nr:uncharacterized protein LY89DRAFT_678503 [Mollisia scopiformis]KUJ06639.1 hypothetical protein LY89DRAFT_678503 [Mollisia scopiformis]